MNTGHWALVVGTLAVAACGKNGDRTEQAPDSGGMTGQMDFGGMHGGMNMRGMQMMPMVRAHLDSMMQMSPQQMQGMMATHQALMSRMMDGMGGDMRQMGMTGDPAWNALSDSVKRDLADLPALEGQALTTRMRAHLDRVRRLMAMHEKMGK